MFKHALGFSMLIGSLGLIGCGGGAEELVKAAQKYEADTCACKDAPCVTKAAEAYSKTSQELAGKKMTPSEDDAKKITDATTKATECATKAAMAGVPGAP